MICAISSRPACTLATRRPNGSRAWQSGSTWKRTGSTFFDLEKLLPSSSWPNYAYQLGLQGKTLVIIGTKRQASKIVEEVAREHGLMYITSRWLGGLLTNWEQVKNSLNRMLELEKGLETGKYAGYTKYEQVQLEKELTRKKRFFEGIRDLKDRPDALVIDPKRESMPSMKPGLWASRSLL